MSSTTATKRPKRHRLLTAEEKQVVEKFIKSLRKVVSKTLVPEIQDMVRDYVTTTMADSLETMLAEFDKPNQSEEKLRSIVKSNPVIQSALGEKNLRCHTGACDEIVKMMKQSAAKRRKK